MSTVLFLADVALANPKRGTPQHTCYMLREIRKEHTLFICAHSVPDEFKDIFMPYPDTRGFAKLLELRRIVTERGITHIFTIGQTGLLAPVLLKFLCRVKISNEIHGLGFEEFYASGRIGLMRYYYMRCKVWLLLHFYDTVFVMSERLKRHYAPMSHGWVLVHGGVDVDEIPDSSTRTVAQQTFIVGYMGNARAYQGLPFLLKAAAVLQDKRIPFRLNLIVSGEETEFAALENELKTRRLPDVTTINRNVSHEEAFRLISGSSVLVIPRQNSPITEFAFPGKLAEYLATGIPTVATCIGPINEMKDDFERVAILVDDGDVAHNIAGALERVYQMGDSERRALGAKARAFAKERFSWGQRGRVFNERFRT